MSKTPRVTDQFIAPPWTPMDAEALAGALLAWYAANRRDLPWRRSRDPYRIWVSEIMLQQTQVDTVIPYYDRFIRRFPDVQALAEAPEEDVIKLWEGLGYYSRARHLHQAAQQLVDRYRGRLPDRAADLAALPGVGRYTAGAVASIAYGEPVSAVDGNVVRVIARLACETESVSAPAVRRRIETLATALIPPGRASDFNQALMELGALVCAPGQPRCSACPVATWCRGLASGHPERLPAKKPRGRPTPVDVAAAWIEAEDEVFIVRRPNNGLLGGLWEFPSGEKAPGESWEGAAARAAREKGGLAVIVDRPLARVEHTFSHRRWDLRLFRCRLADRGGPAARSASAAGGELGRWLAPAALCGLPLPKACHKLLTAVERAEHAVQLGLPL